jgi:hypothetical protein
MELANLTTDQLEQELTRFETLRRQAGSVMVALIAEADRRQVPLGDGCRNTREWVSGRVDADPDDAKVLTNLACSLEDLPEISRRLAEGSIGIARAHLLSRVADQASEVNWLSRTSGLNLAATERLVSRHRRIGRQRERRQERDSWLSLQPSLDESWWRINGGVGAIAGKTISDAIEARADQFPHDEGDKHHRQALALETICRDYSGGEDSKVPSILSFVDFDLANATGGEAGAELFFGPRIGPEALGELLCEGQVQIIGLANGRPVVTSPKARNIPPSIRAYVLWRDGGCRAPGCTSTYRLQPHHVVFHAHGGNNDPANLVTLCWFHHHVVVHRRGYRIEPQPDGSIRFVPPADARDPP